MRKSIKVLNTPRRKQQTVRTRIRSEKEKKSAGKLGVSQYYGKIMDNFLGKKETDTPKRRNKPSISLDTQDFWLLDDKIKVIDNDYEY